MGDKKEDNMECVGRQFGRQDGMFLENQRSNGTCQNAPKMFMMLQKE